MENISNLDGPTIHDNILPVILQAVLVGGRKDEQNLSSVIELHNPLLVINKDGQADAVEEGPLVLDEAFVDEVEVLEGDDAGEKGEDPGQADQVEVCGEGLEVGEEVIHVAFKVQADLPDMFVALRKI
jgi:hypothetical protein